MLNKSDESAVQKLGTNTTECEDEVRCWCLLLAVFFISQDPVVISFGTPSWTETGLLKGADRGKTGWNESMPSLIGLQ